MSNTGVWDQKTFPMLTAAMQVQIKNSITVQTPTTREEPYSRTRFVPAILVASLAATNVKWVQLKTLDTLNKTIAEGK